MEAQIHSLLMPALGESEWSLSPRDRITPGM